MKKMILVLALVVSTNLLAGEKKNITVKGMVCSFCSQGITKKFKDAGVKTVNVSLEKHLVELELADGQKLDDNQITTLLKDAGYGVEKIESK